MVSRDQEVLSILSWNVRGLNSKFKRALLFKYLKSYLPHIVLLQETHLMGSRLLTLKKPWVQKAYHATYSTFSRGVSILISRSLSCMVEDVFSDPQGKYVLVVFLLWGQRYIIVSVYIPPPFLVTPLYSLVEKISLYGPAKLLIMGDFNSILDPVLDRPTPAKKFSAGLLNWAQMVDLVEVWRWKNPLSRTYSCFSTSYKTASRIDLAFVNSAILADIVDAKYLPSGLSDHAPLMLTLCMHHLRDAAQWRLGTHWISHSDIVKKIPPLLVEYWEFNVGSSTSAILWDAFKAYARGQYISAIKAVNKSQRAKNDALKVIVEEQTAQYTADPSELNFNALLHSKRTLHLHITEATRIDLYKNKQKSFEQGDRNGRFLAMMAKHEQSSTQILEIHTTSGDTVRTQPKILETFRQFYQTLYTSQLPSSFQSTELAELLDSVALAWLSDNEREMLVRPITSEEVLSVIGSFSLGKSPGPDGLPIEFYRAHGELLSPVLASLYSDCLKEGSMPDSMSQAHIVLIYKHPKDPSSCASYRPIALLNVDFKILTKLISRRLQPLMSNIIDSDQTGFMPGRSTDVNLRRLYTNIYASHLNMGSRVIASLDIEKAFDTLEWPFLWEVLRRMGFPTVFIKWLQVLYKNPRAAVKMGGGLSASFSLFRGTRQGCPLSPALFAIAMEPVAEALRTSPNIRGLRIGWLEERVALYADDLLLFLNDAGPSLQGALDILDSFSTVTGLKVNWTKSLLFPIDMEARSTAMKDTPLQWVDHFKYLGVVISRQSSEFMSLNLTPILGDTESKLKVWKSLPLSLLGRINLLKMKIIPKFMYLFRHSPQWLPVSFFKRLNQLFSSFLWGIKNPRYKLSTLMRPCEEGGLAFPDLYKYFLATQLVTAAWWLNPDLYNSSTRLEAAVVGSVEALKVLLFRGRRALHQVTIPMLNTIQAWEAGLRCEGYPKGAISPNVPLWLNPTLPQFLKTPEPIAWTKYNIKLLVQVVTDQRLSTFSTLTSMFNLPSSYLFRYYQLSHTFHAEFPQNSLTMIQSTLELVLRSECLDKPTSRLYSHLTLISILPLESLRARWIRDIPDLSMEDWSCVWDFPLRSLVSLRDRVIQFKLIHRAYITPYRLQKINPACSSKCWRCGAARGDFTHIFWTCPYIVTFWMEVVDLLNSITSAPLPFSMSVCLLGLVEDITPIETERIFINTTLFYARKSIALYWKKPHPPPFIYWKQLINNNLPLYRDTYRNRGRPSKYDEVWAKWLDKPYTASNIEGGNNS